MTSPYLAPLVPDIRNLQGRAFARGTTVDHEVSEFITDQTGNVRPADLEKLDAKQRKLESQIADLESERGKALGIAAKFHSLTVEVDRLRKQLETAKQKRDLHLAAAQESLGHAKVRLGEPNENWGIAGNLLAHHLEQAEVANAMSPMIDELSATLTTAEEAVLAFGREHGIAPTASPKG